MIRALLTGALIFKACNGTSLLLFRGIDVRAAAQGVQRRPSLFNMGLDNSPGLRKRLDAERTMLVARVTRTEGTVFSA
jgi:hypothetical protein